MANVILGGHGSQSAPPRAVASPPGPWRLPLAAVLAYAAIRGLGLVVTVLLLPRIPIGGQRYTLAFLIHSWDANRYQTIAVHGYQYIPGDQAPMSARPWRSWWPAPPPCCWPAG